MAVATPTRVLAPPAEAHAAQVRVALAGEPVELVSDGEAHVAVAWAPDAGPSALTPVVRRLREGGAVRWVVGVLATIDATSVRRALESGVDAAVGDEALAAELPVAVRGVCAALLVVPRTARHQLAPPALSYRERQVLALLVEGCTNAEIAGRLFLAESTIKSHLSGAFARLGVRSRRDAAALILDPASGLAGAVLGQEAVTGNRFEPAARSDGAVRRP